MVKNPPAIQEMLFRSLGQEDPLEKEMATHSSRGKEKKKNSMMTKLETITNKKRLVKIAE